MNEEVWELMESWRGKESDYIKQSGRYRGNHLTEKQLDWSEETLWPTFIQKFHRYATTQLIQLPVFIPSCLSEERRRRQGEEARKGREERRRGGEEERRRQGDMVNRKADEIRRQGNKERRGGVKLVLWLLLFLLFQRHETNMKTMWFGQQLQNKRVSGLWVDNMDNVTTDQTLSTDEDHVIWSKALEKARK